MRYLLLFVFLLSATFLKGAQKDPSPSYVTVDPILGQWGNQLFQIAAAYAYSLDHGIPLLLPTLKTDTANNLRFNAETIFLRKIDASPLPLPPIVRWNEPSFNYHPISDAQRVSLMGYYQSEKYFKHRRQEILELFAPPKYITRMWRAKYPFLSSGALVVGVQIRDYRKDVSSDNYHPTKRRPYYEEAMSYFPDDAIFLVSSNNLAFAKECIEGLKPNIIYLEKTTDIEEFYALTLCSSFIISNSSFGWWAAWLSTAPNKKIIAPYAWFSLPYNNDTMVQDLFPKEFTLIYE